MIKRQLMFTLRIGNYNMLIQSPKWSHLVLFFLPYYSFLACDIWILHFGRRRWGLCEEFVFMKKKKILCPFT